MKDKSKKNTYPPIDSWMLRYVVKLKKLLKLSEWDILIDPQPCSSDCLGECQVTYGQHSAVIYLHKNFRKDKPEDIRATLVHELLHCHFGQITEAAMTILEPVEEEPGGRKIVRSTINAIEYQTERVIDSVSEAIVPLLPLPNMPKQKKAIKKKRPNRPPKKIRRTGTR